MNADLTLDSEIRKKLSSDRSDILRDFSVLVSCESPSEDAERLADCAKNILDLVKRMLGNTGAVIEKDGLKTLKFRFGQTEDPHPIVFVCHYDTVHPVGELARNPVRMEGNRMYGPGIFDMKSAIILILWTIKYLTAAGKIARGIVLLITPDEEVGSESSRKLLEDECTNSAVSLVLEPSAGGKLKVGRKGVGTFRVELKGISSHAGLDPEKGASAISELASVIKKVESLQDREKGTTVNVGVISGGSRSNVIPDYSYALVDVRAKTIEEKVRVEEYFRALKTDDDRVSIRVTGSMERPPMEANRKNLEAFEKIRAIGEGLGIHLDSCEVGGASDGNFISAAGVPVVDGVGAVGEGAHSAHEFIYIDETLDRIRLLAASILQW